jgi:hypothetical protein
MVKRHETHDVPVNSSRKSACKKLLCHLMTLVNASNANKRSPRGKPERKKKVGRGPEGWARASL